MSEEIQKYEVTTPATTREYEAMRERLQNFLTVINRPPKPEEIQVNKFAGNSHYLPISYVQMNLDEIFLGQWQSRNFKSFVVANEVCGDMEFGVLHPVSGIWLWRVCGAAVPIQYEAQYEDAERKIKKKVDITNIALKIPNTMVKDYPHLISACLLNGAKTFGKLFGRDLNRKLEDTYTPYYRTPVKEELTKEELEISYLSKISKLNAEEKDFSLRTLNGNVSQDFLKLKKLLEAK